MRAAKLGPPRQSAALGGKQAARDAECRFPVRIRIGVPPEGLGSRLDQIIAWLDANCGADAWTITPSGIRSVVNDALAIYFLETAIASAFVARWCAVYRVWDDEASPISTGASPLMQLTAYLDEAETRGGTRQAEHPRDPASLR